MGADFLYYTLSWIKGQKLNWKAGKEHLRKLALEYQKELKEGKRPTAESNEIPEDESEWIVITDSGYDYTLGIMESYMEDLEAGTNNLRRDCCVTQIGHLQMLLTGGMSWGDDPTDLCTSASALSDCPGLAEAIGFNQFEHDYKKMIDKILTVKEILPTIMHLDPDLDKLIEPRLKTT